MSKYRILEKIDCKTYKVQRLTKKTITKWLFFKEKIEAWEDVTYWTEFGYKQTEYMTLDAAKRAVELKEQVDKTEETSWTEVIEDKK